MQIVIDIPESILNTIQADEMISREQLAVLLIHILKGALLPIGHGRLIDESKIKKCGWNFIDHHAKTDAPTIIEADNTESEE